MSAFTSLKNSFIIAMPNLLDPHFLRSVTYIFEHTPEGAMGIVINTPLNVHLGEILSTMNIPSSDSDVNQMPIMAGGPVQQERGFVIHKSNEKKWESSVEIDNQITLTTSKDILKAIAEKTGPTDAVIALGYAGWTAGQLEMEIANNAWILCPVSSDILFNIPPEKRWRAAAALVGIDVDHLSSDVGHA